MKMKRVWKYLVPLSAIAVMVWFLTGIYLTFVGYVRTGTVEQITELPDVGRFLAPLATEGTVHYQSQIL